MEIHWPLANELEQAWTGVEETDRATISQISSSRFLLMVCLLRYTIQKAKGPVGILYGPPKACMVR